MKHICRTLKLCHTPTKPNHSSIHMSSGKRACTRKFKPAIVEAQFWCGSTLACHAYQEAPGVREVFYGEIAPELSKAQICISPVWIEEGAGRGPLLKY